MSIPKVVGDDRRPAWAIRSRRGLRLARAAIASSRSSGVSRLFPRADLRPLRPWRPDRRERFVAGGVLALCLAIAACFTGLNMFNYPHFESDEGTYLGSAWAMFTEGKLSYYTYTYDHPPLGWLLIGLWERLVGELVTFGMAIDAGRALMLLVTLASTALVFFIVRRATVALPPAFFAASIFAVSPLGVSLHRQVWLDNIATLWLLVAIYLLLSSDAALGRAVLSAVAFGLAFWTKEVMIAFLPGMLVLAGYAAHRDNRRFALGLWSAVALSAVSFFVLLALLKDEFLPPGVLWSADTPHVSMLQTYAQQAARGGSGSFFAASSDIRRFFNEWRWSDPLLIQGGLIGSCIGALFWRRDRFLAGIAVLVVSFALFLGRGGVVLFYYVIPLLALAAIVLGLLSGHVLALARRWRWAGYGASATLVIVTLLLGYSAVGANRTNFTGKETAAQREAARWIADNLPADSKIIMDSYAWVDLRDREFTGGRTFDDAHYYWPIERDKSLQDIVLDSKWNNIDFIAFSPSTEADISTGALQGGTTDLGVRRSDVVRSFQSDGWTVRILRVQKLYERPATSDPILTRTWESYRARFIDGGRVINPQRGLGSTSEGQSLALLRAVYMNDRAAFAQVWEWTRQNLQQSDGLFASRWGLRGDGTRGILDTNSASDADQDIALALLFASRRWQTPEYAAAAHQVIAGIWEYETVTVADRRVLVAGNWARGERNADLNRPVVNPSYFAPYAYRIFAEADSARDWMALVDSSYDILAQIGAAQAYGGQAGVVPNWLMLDPTTGDLLPAESLGEAATRFSYDASRTAYRLTLDWLWFKDDRARAAVQRLRLPLREFAERGEISSAYHLDGSAAANDEALSMYAGSLGAFLFADDRALVHRLFSDKIFSRYESGEAGPHWGNPDDFYDQNWGWFATALIDGSLSNLWAGQTVIRWGEVLPEALP
jgi:endo-1,4-beta-D-glucanase Y/4-amino-4-deoxy-L-arabinose transferase-like glycosyltransferase